MWAGWAEVSRPASVIVLVAFWEEGCRERGVCVCVCVSALLGWARRGGGACWGGETRVPTGSSTGSDSALSSSLLMLVLPSCDSACAGGCAGEREREGGGEGCTSECGLACV